MLEEILSFALAVGLLWFILALICGPEGYHSSVPLRKRARSKARLLWKGL